MTDTSSSETPEPPKARAENWERDAIERLASAALVEQRRARRWGIFFKLFFAAYLLFLLLLAIGGDMGPKAVAGRHTALVDLDGAITADSLANADNVITGLRAAFGNRAAAGVILRVNSPGGSPVHAGYIYDEIKRLRAKHPDTPLYAVVTDICASGCYYAVAAADKIYADQASIVGSIGVLMNGFGFTETMKKLGVERRLLTAGEHKGILDPFSPMKPQDRRHAQDMLNRIHAQFIAKVREGRGQALKETRDMFSGLFWTGEQAKAMGLVDELGSAGFVAREVIAAESIVDYTYRENFVDRFARRLGSGMAQALGTDLLNSTPLLR